MLGTPVVFFQMGQVLILLYKYKTPGLNDTCVQHLSISHYCSICYQRLLYNSSLIYFEILWMLAVSLL